MGYLIELTLAYNTQNNPPSYHSFHPRHLQQQQQPRRRGGRYTESPPRGAPTSPALSITTPVDAQFKLWSIYIYPQQLPHPTDTILFAGVMLQNRLTQFIRSHFSQFKRKSGVLVNRSDSARLHLFSIMVYKGQFWILKCRITGGCSQFVYVSKARSLRTYILIWSILTLRSRLKGKPDMVRMHGPNAYRLVDEKLVSPNPASII